MGSRITTRSARRVDVVGGGHSGMAMDHALSQRSIDHVVIERGEVANAWLTERWDSLRLLTPNWMTRLPDRAYDGDDPHGYMSSADVAAFVRTYAAQIARPVVTYATVLRVEPVGPGYCVTTTHGAWVCRAVVLATAGCSVPVLPKLATQVSPDIAQWTAHTYCNPDQLGTGAVLVVGASATGLQLAHELQGSGRQVTLAVGEHVRMPRVYRGLDVQWWLLSAGVLDQRIEDVDDPERARRVASPQLIGTPQRAIAAPARASVRKRRVA